MEIEALQSSSNKLNEDRIFDLKAENRAPHDGKGPSHCPEQTAEKRTLNTQVYTIFTLN